MAYSRRWMLGVFGAVAALAVLSPQSHALTFAEAFETPASSGQLGALYPDLAFTTSGQWAVSGGQAEAAKTSKCVATQKIDAFEPGGYIIEGDMGIPSGSPVGGYNLGLQFAGRRFVFHPGYSGGAFRCEGILIGGTSNQNIGFTPPLDVAHHMQIQSSGADQYRVTITDPTDPLNHAYQVSFAEPSPPTAAQDAGFTLSGSVDTHAGFFDNLRLSKPHLRLNANNPTDGGRTDGVTAWADSGGTLSDATLTGLGANQPSFQQGATGTGEAVAARTYQFGSSDYAHVADTAATHAENFVVDGWYKLDRLPGVEGSSSWQMFAENGDWYQGAEWAWFNDSSKTMRLYYSTGSGLTNNVNVGFAHGMEFLPDQFVHLAAAKEGSTVSMYVNGQLLGSTDTGNTAVADRTAGITVGSWHRNGGWGGDWANAQIGEFQFHDLDADGRTAAQVVAEDYAARYYDFHNHHPIRLEPDDPDDGGRTAAVPTLWADSGGNENDATLHGPELRVLAPQWPNTVQFEAGDYARITDSVSTHRENFLIEGWFQFDRVRDAGEGGSDVTIAQNGDLFAGAGDPSTFGAEWYLFQSGGNLSLWVWDVAAAAYNDAALHTLSAPLGFSESLDFHHLAAAKDGDELYLYIDGMLAAQTTMAGFSMLKDGLGGIAIGSYLRNGGSTGDWFEGQIGAFNIWDLDWQVRPTGLSLGEFVRQSYQERAGTFIPEPLTLVLLGGGLAALARRRRRR